MRVLIVDDEDKTVKFLSKGLKEEGYATTVARDGEDALEIALSQPFDVIILDVMLPRRNGTAICQELRRQGISTPVIMLSARDTVQQRIEGLDSGADDYLVKPFSFAELTARLRTVLRRKEGQPMVLNVGDLHLDPVARRAKFGDKELNLSAKEFALLMQFMKRPGHILSRTALAEAAWGVDFDSGTNVVDVYINFLRRKLRDASNKDWIVTHRSQGYSFVDAE